MDDEQSCAWLALALCSCGRPDIWHAIVRACGGVLETIGASDETLARRGASQESLHALRRAWPAGSRGVLERCRRLGIEVSPSGSEKYPELLAAISDPPLVLFWRGAEPASCQPAVAIVGARRCTAYGERTAARIAREAAELGIVVISGLARGIDAAAHRGALEGGRTAAVLAGGLERIYPGEHRALAERVVAGGGFLLSEQPPGVQPLPWLFPFRNRIITGLCAATVVVEAASRSGSLASARHALAQGREVLAVPGPIDSPLSVGTNRLIAQGAPPLCETADLEAARGLREIIERSSLNNSKRRTIPLEQLSAEERSIVTAIGARDATADEICAATSLDGTRVLALLTALELAGVVSRGDHGRFRTASRGD